MTQWVNPQLTYSRINIHDQNSGTIMQVLQPTYYYQHEHQEVDLTLALAYNDLWLIVMSSFGVTMFSGVGYSWRCPNASLKQVRSLDTFVVIGCYNNIFCLQ